MKPRPCEWEGWATIDLLFRFLHQNGGRLSKRARSEEFARLSDEEAAAAERAYQDSFEPV